MLGGVSGCCFDPRVTYDVLSNRWFASTVDGHDDSLRLAVSTSSDPTSTWNVWELKSQTGGTGFDYDQFGVSGDKVVIGVDPTTASNGGRDEYFILSKSELTAGQKTLDIVDSGPTSSVYRIAPVTSVTAGSTMYMVSVCTGTSCGNGNTNIHVYYITGVPPNTVYTTEYTFPMDDTVQNAPNAQEPLTNNKVAVGDASVQTAVWSSNNLWLAFTENCTPSGDSSARACVHFMELDTTQTPPGITQYFDDGSKGMYYFYPALSIDQYGDMGAVMGYSNSTFYPAVAVSGQISGHTGYTDETILIIFPQANYTSYTENRWGDVFSASLDPSDLRLIWVAGEYASEAGGVYHWSTYMTSAAVGLLYLTMNPGAGGTVSPSSGWYSIGSNVQISASGSSCHWVFTGWSGSGPGSYSGTASPYTITMQGPDGITETAKWFFYRTCP